MSRRAPVFPLFLPSKHGDFNFLVLSLFRFRQTLVNRPQNPASHSADDETDNKFGAVEKHINHFVKRLKLKIVNTCSFSLRQTSSAAWNIKHSTLCLSPQFACYFLSFYPNLFRWRRVTWASKKSIKNQQR